jgi:hypothetical protein
MRLRQFRALWGLPLAPAPWRATQALGYGGVEAPLAALHLAGPAAHVRAALAAHGLGLVALVLTSGPFTPHAVGAPGHAAPGAGLCPRRAGPGLAWLPCGLAGRHSPCFLRG